MLVHHFLDLSSAGADGVAAMLADALDRKQARAGWPKGKPDADRPLDGRVLAMIFEKSSTRTRVSFDMAIRQLGGTSIVMDAGSMQLGRGETIADTARVLSRYVDAIMIRTDDPVKLEEMAEYATVPVINGLTDRSHPCQIVADLLTAIEKGVQLPGSKWAWLGDGNNVLHSIIEAAGLFGFSVGIGCPEGYDPDDSFVREANARLAGSNARVTIERDPVRAAADADVVVTDTWVSMGQADSADKIAAMTPYQVNRALMAHARPQATFLHCLPAHRGEEATDEILDGNQSAIWDEAENRLHAQKAVLLWCFGLLNANQD
ncbi:ornithine carbamoyltransferase [Sphingomonas changbaiensis NBRC 104936]|uniref:Ornithine carbamoyltransferase n=1 Tax=Sphingomonas changbaiensis NBRC 104936 TaxID=1219043 RepID=A0A0E9ML95_9SPHN|nr:ornithine carbamoyltransferase [Sphingomonas changbaiensis]GAO38191.1 ornithine carbamoyltransferase [Sphingomonas changbaiensis NBRC 104936]